MSIRLYVGNLPAELDRQALEQVFNEFGESVSLKVITDRKTSRCRGFGFVTVDTSELADTVIEKFNGYDFNGAVLKLEKALPRNKGKAGEGEADDTTEASDDGETAPVQVNNNPAPKAAARKNKSKRSGSNRSPATTTSTSTEAHQPDPRWAQELEKLKQQLLAAQATK